jgi:hypothetical protein
LALIALIHDSGYLTPGGRVLCVLCVCVCVCVCVLCVCVCVCVLRVCVLCVLCVLCVRVRARERCVPIR